MNDFSYQLIYLEKLKSLALVPDNTPLTSDILSEAFKDYCCLSQRINKSPNKQEWEEFLDKIFKERFN